MGQRRRQRSSISVYFLANLPEGDFEVVAAKSGLGTGTVSKATVRGDARSTASDLVLALNAPRVSSLDPANGASGSVVTIRGEHFGFETNEPVSVTFSGAPAANVQRRDNGSILATVPSGAQSGNVAVEGSSVAVTPGGVTTTPASLASGFPCANGSAPVGWTLEQPAPSKTVVVSANVVNVRHKARSGIG